MVVRGWSELGLGERLELVRSEVRVCVAFSNAVFFALVVLVCVLAPFTRFSVWVPGLLFVLSLRKVVLLWGVNSVLVRGVRGSCLVKKEVVVGKRK